MKWIPNIIITIPPMILNISKYSYNKPLRKLAEAPRSIKIVENPKTKLTAYLKIFILIGVSLSKTLSSEVPAIKQRYPGTMGKTQGERKLKSPAKRT